MQNADTAWNSEYAMALTGPTSFRKVGYKMAAPTSSNRMTPFTTKCVMRTIPPTLSAEIESCMIFRCPRLIFRRMNVESIRDAVITPIPPIWIMQMITDFPKSDQ